MADKLDMDLKPDHVAGGFEWETEPHCKCGQVKQAVESRFMFVSNITDQGSNFFYLLPVDADGRLFKRDGVQIAYCPWCGDKITGHKKYPTKQ
jgi:hypothetical protein